MHRLHAVAAWVGALELCACATQKPEPPSLMTSPAEASRPATTAVAPEVPSFKAALRAAPERPAKPRRQALYDESADVKQQIDAALISAKRDNRRVLIVWGGNWCGWCHALHNRLDHDKELHKELLYEYEVVLADAGWDGKNVDLALTYGADLNEGHYPFMTILDASSRKPIAQQSTGSMVITDRRGKASMEYGHDPAQLLKFFKAHEAPRQDASSVFKASSNAAKTSGRLVFLHFGAPWCKPCQMLDRFLARKEMSELFAKDYVDVKIDQDRMPGAKELFERYKNGSEPSGIPWIAVVDPSTGKALADSDGPEGNTGYPMTPEEIQHFMGMLRKTAKRATSSDLEQIEASIKKSS